MGLCCGQPVRRRQHVETKPLPGNPAVRDAIRLLYLGADSVALRGEASRLRYYVAPQRRDFVVERKDAEALLRRRDVILAAGEVRRS